MHGRGLQQIPYLEPRKGFNAITEYRRILPRFNGVILVLVASRAVFSSVDPERFPVVDSALQWAAIFDSKILRAQVIMMDVRCPMEEEEGKGQSGFETDSGKD
jgi:hypothetical protein